MSRDNISSGELDRLDVIAACKAVEKRIKELRHESREQAIAHYQAPRQGRLARWLGLDPVTRTREEAEKLADQGEDFIGPDHFRIHGRQLDLVSELRALAEASQAPTIRVTREDFDFIEFGWKAVQEQKRKPKTSTAILYPGAACNQCGWVGKRVDLVGDDEACPECHRADTSWLTPEELEKETTA